MVRQYDKFTSHRHQRPLLWILLVFGLVTGIVLGIEGLSPLTTGLLLGLIAIPFVLLTISKPWIAVSLFLLLVPLENLFVFGGSFTSTMTKLVGAYLAFLVILSGSIKYIGDVFKNKKALWILLFGTISIVSLFISRDINNSLKHLITLWLSIVLYFVLIMMIRDTRTLRFITLALITGTVLSILSPIILGHGAVLKDVMSRYGGLWGDPNEFAAFLLVLIPLSVVLFLTSKTRTMKIITAILTLVLFAGFVLTYSRGGFISFGLIIVLTMFKVISGKNRIKILAVSIPCIFVAFAAFYFLFADEFITRMETLSILESRESVRKDDALNLRYYYYFELGPEIFAKNPVFGVGFRDFKSHNIYKDVSHNTFLEVLTGMGVVGFIPFVMILYLTWKETRIMQRIRIRDDDDAYLSSMAIALELGLLSYLVAGLFVTLDLAKMTWILITLSAVTLNVLRIHNTALASKETISAGRSDRPGTYPGGNYAPGWIKY